MQPSFLSITFVVLFVSRQVILTAHRSHPSRIPVILIFTKELISVIVEIARNELSKRALETWRGRKRFLYAQCAPMTPTIMLKASETSDVGEATGPENTNTHSVKSGLSLRETLKRKPSIHFVDSREFMKFNSRYSPRKRGDTSTTRLFSMIFQ